eukprot:4174593-Prymnesium_polylepis.1
MARERGKPYSERQIRSLFRRADADNNRVIDFKEFIQMQLRRGRSRSLRTDGLRTDAAEPPADGQGASRTRLQLPSGSFREKGRDGSHRSRRSGRGVATPSPTGEAEVQPADVQ